MQPTIVWDNVISSAKSSLQHGLFFRTFSYAEQVAFFDVLHAFILIRQGHKQFGDESQGRREVFVSVYALLFEQSLPV